MKLRASSSGWRAVVVWKRLRRIKMEAAIYPFTVYNAHTQKSRSTRYSNLHLLSEAAESVVPLEDVKYVLQFSIQYPNFPCNLERI